MSAALPPGDAAPSTLIEAGRAVGRWVGHVGAVFARAPDLLDASRSLAKVGLPRALRGPVVQKLSAVIEAVAAGQLAAGEVTENERVS